MGWVKALPLVRFNLMNTVNVSSGFSPFQLRMGRSPRLIPPLVAQDNTATPSDNGEHDRATAFIVHLHMGVSEAQDNLLAAKISQAEFANRHHVDKDTFEVGDKVMLATENRRHEYIQSKSGRVAKFMPCSDRSFLVTNANPGKLFYMLDLPNEPNHFPTFHSSQLC